MQDELLKVVDVFYDSIGDEFDADRVLKAYSQATDDSGIALANVSAPGSLNPMNGSYLDFWTHNTPDEADDIFRAQLREGEDNLTLHHFFRLPERAQIFLSSLIPGDRPREHDMFQELSRPWGIHSELMSVVHREQSHGSFSLILRYPGQAPLDNLMLAKTRVLDQHLSRVIALQRRLNQLDKAISRTSNALDLINFGLILYGGNDSMFVNRFARKVLDKRDGLELGRLSLIIQDRSASQKYQDILRAVHSNKVVLAARSGGTVRVPRPSGERPYNLQIIPLHGHNKSSIDNVSVAVFLIDPTANRSAMIEYFTSSYGFTPTEAALACDLAQGTSLEEFTIKRGVSRNTAKWHLQAIFEKTETSRQSELVSLLLRSVAGIDFES